MNEKIYCYYKIVESYREDGKVKHKTLFTLGILTHDQAERIRLVLSAHSNPEVIVSPKNDIVVTKHLSFLDIAILHQLWHEWGFEEYFKNNCWIEAITLNRLIDPVAKYGLKEWLCSNVLPGYLAFNPNSLDTFAVYRELDRVDNIESELQAFIFKALSKKYPDIENAFFYDITSTYVTGSSCVISSFGYSRDSRPDCEQVVIALMITPDGYPFYWKVLKGNTQDITTIKSLISDVKSRFSIKKCTMIFDRGMVSKDNLESLETEEWVYVSAVDKDEIQNMVFFQKIFKEPLSLDSYEQFLAMKEFLPLDENEFTYYQEFQSNNRRYILMLDIARFQKERQAFSKRLFEFQQWIDEKNNSLANAKKSRSEEPLRQQVLQYLKRKHLNKLFKVTIEPIILETTNKKGLTRNIETFKLFFETDEQTVLKEQRLHGITCFVSNISKEEKTAQVIVKWYRDKNKVEEAFHEIKSHLDLRPIYLTRESRVKAHVTACVLACFLYNDIEKRLKDNRMVISTESALNILGQCKMNKISFKGTNESRLSITEPTEEQKQILKGIQLESVLNAKGIQSVIKNLENWM